MSGVIAISEALKANSTLLSVKCVMPSNPLPYQLVHKTSAPLDAILPLYPLMVYCCTSFLNCSLSEICEACVLSLDCLLAFGSARFLKVSLSEVLAF